jgi:diguanylate cyclase (GGDEF)-like protein
MAISEFFANISLKAKISTIFLLLFLTSVGGLTYITTSRLQKDVVEVLANQQFASVSYIASEIDQTLRTRLELLATVAGSITPEMLSNEEKLLHLFKERPLLSNFFTNGVVVISKESIGILSYPVFRDREGASYAGVEYFNEVIKTGKPAIGKPRIGRFTKMPGLGFAVPVLDNTEQIIAVLAGFTTLSDPSLFGQLERANVGKSGWIAISAPKHNMIVTASDPKRALNPLPKRGVNFMLDRFIDGFEGSGITVNSMGIETLTSAKWIPSAGWFVQAVLPTKEAYAPLHAMVNHIYNIAGAFALLAGLLTWLIIRRLLSPLEVATKNIKTMATTEDATLHELPISQHDEVGELLKSFNLLVNQRSQLENELETQARTDSLTGLFNRRHFLELAEAGLARTLRYGGALSVLMLDIDHFKKINDSHGHKTGDLVLTEMAGIFAQILRETDIVGRMGGEEFAIFMPETTEEQALAVAERLRVGIANLPIKLENGTSFHFTASIGASSLAAKDHTVDNLICVADKALYEAKNGGRNRVVAASGVFSA